MSQRFFRFLLVGSTGFVTDAAVLSLLLAVGIGPFVGRVLSIAAGTLVTWRLNRHLTFAPSAGSQLAEGSRYAMVVGVASTVNWLTYAALLLAFPALPPLIALAGGSIVALSVSYLGFSRFAFR